MHVKADWSASQWLYDLKLCLTWYKCYDHAQLKLTEWVERKNCVVSDIRWWVEHQLNHESDESTLSRLSQLFEGWLSFYIERIVSLMKTIVFNSIQVINYWFTLHCVLRFLYQQAQTFSPYIWGISDQNITLWTFLQYKNDNQCAEVSFNKLSQFSRPSANNQCTQGISTQLSWPQTAWVSQQDTEETNEQ